MLETRAVTGRSPQRRAARHYRTAVVNKTFATVVAGPKVLQLIPTSRRDVEAPCYSETGLFGYEAEHYEMSMKIGERGVLPRIRAASAKTLLAANGTSYRHQIADAAGREARHLGRILDEASAGA
jgi:hypothetical protein